MKLTDLESLNLELSFYKQGGDVLQQQVGVGVRHLDQLVDGRVVALVPGKRNIVKRYIERFRECNYSNDKFLDK